MAGGEIGALNEELWREVDRHTAERLGGDDAALLATREAMVAAGLPAIEVTAPMGKFLQLLVRISGARRILEIGTLGGYSTIWLARGLGDGGRLLSLEIDPERARVARENVERSGLGGVVEVRVGPAADSLQRLADERGEPFDLVFVDADKASTAAYVEWAIRLGRPGTVIIVDNVVRGGAVARGDEGPDSEGMRRFFEMTGSEPRLSATALQTVGSKGHDGFAIAVVNAEA